MAIYSKTKKEIVHRKYGGRCAYCGHQVKVITIDHIVPKKNGGISEVWNLLPACGPCNTFKGDLSIEQFRQKIEKILGVDRSIGLDIAMKFGQVEVTKTKIVFLFES